LIVLQPPGWPFPKGYVNGMLAEGRVVTVAGMVGWDEQGVFAEGLVAQVRQALLNVLAVLHEAEAGPETIARMTWYVTDMVAYRGAGRALTPVWRETMGSHYPAMAVVGVTALVEPLACVEIDALAILP
jgi:enamine deaminase RidA (YjgF/YER057c/UK114 family)